MSEWTEKPLGELADVQLGKMLDQKKNIGDYHPYLGNDNVQWGSIELDEVKEMRFKDSELEKFALRNGDLLVCEGGDPGRCALWLRSDEMYYQKALNRVRVGKVLDPAFLFYELLYMGKTREIRQYYTGGATIKHMPKAALESVLIRYPSLDEQRRIAGVLAAYDKLIENNRRQIALLEEAAQRLYKEWFIDLRFPGHETTPIHDGLSEGWRRTTLGAEVTVIRGASYSSDQLTDDGVNSLVNLGNIQPFGGYRAGREKPFAGTGKTEQQVEFGDVIIGLTEQAVGLAGYAALVPTMNHKAVISADLAKLIPHVSGSENYLYCSLRFGGLSRQLSPFASGTKIKHLKPADLALVEYVRPDELLLQRFCDAAKPLFANIDILLQQSAAAREARDRLLPKLMSGEIQV